MGIPGITEPMGTPQQMWTTTTSYKEVPKLDIPPGTRPVMVQLCAFHLEGSNYVAAKEEILPGYFHSFQVMSDHMHRSIFAIIEALEGKMMVASWTMFTFLDRDPEWKEALGC